MREVLTWGGIALLIFFVAFRPEDAVDAVRSLGAVFTYFTDLFAGIFV